MKRKYNKTAVILAGGKGSRMGHLNKGRLKYEGQTFIEHLIKKLDRYAEIIIISNSELEAIEGVRIIQDEVKDIGPLGGIYTGLIHSSYSEILVLSCDTPFIEQGFLNYLGGLRGEYEIALTTDKDKYEPLISLYKKTIIKDIEDLIDGKKYKISLLFEDVKVKNVNLHNLKDGEIIKKSMRNINTLKELKSAGGYI